MNRTIILTKEQMNEFANNYFNMMQYQRGLSLRSMYETMQTYKELAKDFGIDDSDVENLASVVKWKKRIREKLKREEQECGERRIVCVRGGDSVIVLIRLGEFDCLGDANDYFMWNEYMECRPSQYDCTGQLFTNWYHIFKRNDVYYAYHCISIDV